MKKKYFFRPISDLDEQKKFFSTKIYFISNHLLRIPKSLHSCPNRIITSRTRDTDLHFVTKFNGPHPMKSKNSKINYINKSFLRHLQAFLGYIFFRKNKYFFLSNPRLQVTKKNIFSTKNYFISIHVLRTPKRLHRCPNSIITSRTRDIEIPLFF